MLFRSAVGVPVTDPVEALMARPAGRPVADQVNVWPDWESVAELVRVVMAVPVVPDWADRAATVTVLATVQVKVAEPDEPALSTAVTVTVAVPGVVGVPESVPVEAPRAMPAGRPGADQLVMVAVAELSVAVRVTGAMAEPVVDVRDEAFWTATRLVTVQAIRADPAAPVVSVATRVTRHEQAAVGVPDTVPVAGSSARPAGSPVADQVSV